MARACCRPWSGSARRGRRSRPQPAGRGWASIWSARPTSSGLRRFMRSRRADMRLAVYTDYAYRRDRDGAIYGERSFVLFLSALRTHVDRLVFVGRLNPAPGRSYYRVPEADFVPLPYHSSLTRPHEAVWSMLRSLGRFWRVLDD